MADGSDWRIDNAEHVRGQSFRRKRYYQWSESWDHDHCSACFDKFSLLEGDLTEGYAVTESDPHGADYHWVCATCFEDLKDVMAWRVVT